ncbi:hypothetical protein [Salinibacter ruber]|uniref:hypothetical protein n=1 Tax=Salinibacter ruber TaxID=146919 RepID=UPI00216A9307|nr:hypothetical protein [Salinibacter ruber]MCS4102396.1 hypothetical protein [Salinibacter ruber]
MSWTGAGDREEPLHLLTGEHRRKPFGPVGAVDGPDLIEFYAQHLFVEKDQGAVQTHFLPHVRSVRALGAWF